MKRSGRLSRALAVALIGCGSLTACAGGHDAFSNAGFVFTSPGGHSEFAYSVGQRQQVQELGGPSVDGGPDIRLSTYRGRVVLLNFWGSWCPDCAAETPGLVASWNQLRSRNVQFLGVDVEDSRSSAAAFATDHAMTYPSIYDESMRTLLSFRGLPTAAIPLSMIIDAHGRVAYIWLREVSGTEVAAALKAVLDER